MSEHVEDGFTFAGVIIVIAGICLSTINHTNPLSVLLIFAGLSICSIALIIGDHNVITKVMAVSMFAGCFIMIILMLKVIFP